MCQTGGTSPRPSLATESSDDPPADRAVCSPNLQFAITRVTPHILDQWARMTSLTSPPALAKATSDPADGRGPDDGLIDWQTPAGPRPRPTVKCPRCRTVGTDEDVRCVSCRAPLGADGGRLPPAAVGGRVARLALLGLAVGAGLGPIVGDGIMLVPRTAGGPNVNLILWGCLGGGIGAAIGCALGLVWSCRH